MPKPQVCTAGGVQIYASESHYHALYGEIHIPYSGSWICPMP